jgi:carbamoyltransferase
VSSTLGISFGYHDSGVALITENGEIFAEHEERFTRRKFDSSFPKNSLNWLFEAGLTSNIKKVCHYEVPSLKRRRMLLQFLHNPPRSENRAQVINSIWLTTNRNFRNYIKDSLSNLGIYAPIEFMHHHQSHAAASYFTSSFKDSAILVVDGVGEFDCTSIWNAKNNKLTRVKSLKFPNSLGLFYAAFTNYCGFKVNSGEYKFMGLAPYGRPVFKDLILRDFLRLDPHGLYRVDHKKLGLGNFDGFKFDEIVKTLGHSKRLPHDSITNFHADVAASVQACLNLAMVNLANYAIEITGNKSLCIAGGVGLNCVSNQKISEVIGEENTYFFSASGDAGGALGAAALGHLSLDKNFKTNLPLDIKFSKLGRSFSSSFCKSQLKDLDIPFEQFSDFDASKIIANLINEGKIGAIFYGRSEFGPRALGNRSILADARIPKGQIYINKRIKFRESFRPFAPIVLEEQAQELFMMSLPSPYMLKTVQVRNFIRKGFKCMSTKEEDISISAELNLIDSTIPAATHLDGSARVQTISPLDTSITRKILENFYSLTGCPALINTSFNVRGEPIVSTPFEAINCFMTTGIDFLYLEGCIISKTNIPENLFDKFTSKHSKD